MSILAKSTTKGIRSMLQKALNIDTLGYLHPFDTTKADRIIPSRNFVYYVKVYSSWFLYQRTPTRPLCTATTTLP